MRPEKQKIVTPNVVSALCNGDHMAYKKVYMHYRRPVESFVFKLTGSADAVDDIAQEIFMNLWEQRHRLDPDGNIGGYLYRMAKNKALKYLYNNRNRTKSYADSYAETLTDNREATDSLEAEELQLLIDIAVFNMPKQRKEIFTLYRKGMSNEEIAAALNTTTHNVKQHILLARRELRETITFAIALLMVN